MFSWLLRLNLESTQILTIDIQYNSLNVQLFAEADPAEYPHSDHCYITPSMFSCLLRLTIKSTHIRTFVIHLPLLVFSCLLRLTLDHVRTFPPLFRWFI